MGFLDDIISDVRVITGQIDEFKQEFVSSVLDPSGELRDTVNQIAGEITGKTSDSSETKIDK
jgi:division protein CdvB (Snf7/Vps24/ESCRT-III family)